MRREVFHAFDCLFRFSPVGILFLIASEIVDMDNPVEELKKLGM